MTVTAEPSASERIASAVTTDERNNLLFATRVRLWLLAISAAWLSVGLLVNWRGQLFYVVVALGFIILGLAERHLLRSGSSPRLSAMTFATADALLLGFCLIAPNPLLVEQFPAAFQLQGHNNSVWFILFLVLRAFALDPRLVLWAGVSAVLGWGTLLAAAALDPRSRIIFVAGGLPGESDNPLLLLRDPYVVSVALWLTQAIVLLLIAAALAGIVHRARRMALERAAAERARSNLSRYFSPTILEQLQDRDHALAEVRRGEVAVLFVDMVGFTSVAERWPAEDVMAMLRAYHARMEAAVFQYGGTVEKFIGDAMLATFGVPFSKPDDATRALSCAVEMLKQIDDWNAARVGDGDAALAVGIGLHFGPVVMGDIGSERAMAYATVGDSINLASRLQTMSRDLSCRIVASRAFVDRVRSEGDRFGQSSVLSNAGQRTIRGRNEPVEVWCA
jgi:adenylate cyclase